MFRMATKSEKLDRIWGWVQRNMLLVIGLLYMGGSVPGLMSMPFAAHPGRIDEKALQLGVAYPQCGVTRASEVVALRARLASRLSQGRNKGMVVDVGHEARVLWDGMHWKSDARNRQHRLAWNRDGRYNSTAYVYDVVEGTRSDGTESILLVFPMRCSTDDGASAASLAMSVGHGLSWYLQDQEWLAKNVIVAYVDVSKYAGIHLAMDDLLSIMPQDRRVGQIQQSIIVDIQDGSVDWMDSSSIKMHGWNGQVPNFDMFLVARRSIELFAPKLAVWSEKKGSRGKETEMSRYYSSVVSLARFVGKHAFGLSDGGHALLLERSIDALTVEFTSSRKAASKKFSSEIEGMKSMLQTCEGMIRALNNLQERLHHSTALYALAGPVSVIDIGVYMVCPGLLFIAQCLKSYRSVARVMSEKNKSIAWDSAVGAAVLILMSLLGLYFAIQAMAVSYIVNGKTILYSFGTVWSVLRNLCMMIVVMVVLWKFCAHWAELWAAPQTVKTTTRRHRAGDIRATKAAFSVFISSLAACLLLYRWSLAWILLSLTVPL
mmetsp:Transcript_10099/g.19899  ORF Transcript_10099/g.19899 Transcript_10099/m.19899 type:complete len:546 (+) Transcript_10099:152-1789(+)